VLDEALALLLAGEPPERALREPRLLGASGQRDLLGEPFGVLRALWVDMGHGL